MSRKYVYYRHKATGLLDEMNWWEWEHLQQDPNRRVNFELVKIVDLDEPGKVQEEVKEIPIVKDNLQCPLCGKVAKNERGLKTHKAKKHAG